MISIQNLLKNVSVARAEFKAQNESVFSSFVKPPFYEQINILNAQHSIALVGGSIVTFAGWTLYGFVSYRFDVNKSLSDVN